MFLVWLIEKRKSVGKKYPKQRVSSIEDMLWLLYKLEEKDSIQAKQKANATEQ